MKMELTEELASETGSFSVKNTLWEKSTIFEFALIDKASFRMNLTFSEGNWKKILRY